MSAWTYRRLMARPPIRLFRLVLESHDGRALALNSEEKHEPASGVDTELVDSLIALDPEGPIREADIRRACSKSPLCAIGGRPTLFRPLFGTGQARPDLLCIPLRKRKIGSAIPLFMEI